MTRRIPELDGLRGVAILLVLIVHFGDYDPTRRIAWASAVRAAIGFGWAGVDLFFVLSGFLITGILIDAKGSKNYFRAFYARRALRILPLYYGSLLAFFAVALPWAHATGHWMAARESEQIWYWTYLANWRIALHPFLIEPLSHFWTLAIEEQFYLVWPIAVFACGEKTLRRLCIGTIVGCLALRGLPAFQAEQARHPEFLYNLTPFRVDSLAFGALAALAARDPRWRRALHQAWPALLAVGGAGLLAAVAAARSARYYTGPMTWWGYSSIGLLALGLVAYCLFREGADRAGARLLRGRALRRFGQYSYAMYVLHWPLSPFVSDFFQARIAGAGGLAAALASIAAGIALSFALGAASWKFYESNFLRWKDRFPYRAQ